VVIFLHFEKNILKKISCHKFPVLWGGKSSKTIARIHHNCLQYVGVLLRFSTFIFEYNQILLNILMDDFHLNNTTNFGKKKPLIMAWLPKTKIPKWCITSWS
jgi:hypothetical protein